MQRWGLFLTEREAFLEINMSVFEAAMLICFGVSWPVSIARSLRTGVVIGTWLIQSGLSEPQEVVGCLRHLRRDIPDAAYPSPENEDQLAFVHRWRSEARSS